MSDSLQHHGLQHTRPTCWTPTTRVYSNSCPLRRPCHPMTSNCGPPVQHSQACNLHLFSSVQSLSRVQLCDATDCSTPGFPDHHQHQSLLKLMCIESVMPSNRLILCRPLLLSPSISFLASGSFQMSQLFPSGGQSVGALASASVLPVNIQG